MGCSGYSDYNSDYNQYKADNCDETLTVGQLKQLVKYNLLIQEKDITENQIAAIIKDGDYINFFILNWLKPIIKKYYPRYNFPHYNNKRYNDWLFEF